MLLSWTWTWEGNRHSNPCPTVDETYCITQNKNSCWVVNHLWHLFSSGFNWSLKKIIQKLMGPGSCFKSRKKTQVDICAIHGSNNLEVIHDRQKTLGAWIFEENLSEFTVANQLFLIFLIQTTQGLEVTNRFFNV